MGCGQSDLTESELSILRLGELVHTSDASASKVPGSGHPYLEQASKHLHRIDEEERDNYSILVFSRHGKQYMLERDLPRAIESYTKAINLAEVKIAERCRGLYLMLQRYSECMTDIARIWIGSARGEVSASGQSLSAGLAESSAPSGQGGVSSNSQRRNSSSGNNMSDNNLIGAVAGEGDGLSRRGSTQNLARKASIATMNTKRRKRDEATAEIVLLRCIETIEEGHNRRSDLLIDPLMQLSSLYEGLHLYARAELLVRRCIGILIVQYGHDHPKLSESNERLEGLVVKKEAKNEDTAATNIQKTFRMHREMNRLADELGRDVHRHTLEEAGGVQGDRSPTPPANFLQQLIGEDEEEGAVDRGGGGNEEGAGAESGDSSNGGRKGGPGTASSASDSTLNAAVHSPGLNSQGGGIGSFQEPESQQKNGGHDVDGAEVGQAPPTKDAEELERLTRKQVDPVHAAVVKPYPGAPTVAAGNTGIGADGNQTAANSAPALWSVPGEYSDAEGEEDDV